MVRQFRPVDRDQPMMLPEDMHLWVGKDHLVWFVIDVVGGLDVSGLEGPGKPGRGRPGYDPRMLAVLLVYAYLQGVRSSRRIEERCRTDAAFRLATGNQVPDHAAIARFRAAAAAREGGPLEDLFLQVLFVLAAAGLPSAWSRAGTILFDNGFFSKGNIELPGPDRLIGTGNWKDPGPHGPGCRHEDLRDQMHHNLATRQGQDLYRNRAPVSEGGFADLKERTGLRQFSMRGLPKAGGELLLAMLACNVHLGWRRGISPA
jgi:transposase